uniref:Uncharacterized protein n=1 Tax=Mycena chlorophos TaxID=658473 RepID=A0ABQ0LAT2_MYCCL|nr:predicted protein [Mycena chlorophos]
MSGRGMYTCQACPFYNGNAHQHPSLDRRLHDIAVAKERRRLARENAAKEQAVFEKIESALVGVVLTDDAPDPWSQQQSVPEAPVELPTLSTAEGFAAIAAAASATAKTAARTRPVPLTKTQMREMGLKELLERLDAALERLNFVAELTSEDALEAKSAELTAAGSLAIQAGDILKKTKASQRARSPEVSKLWQDAWDKAVELDNQIDCIGALLPLDEDGSEQGGGGDEPGQVYNTDKYFENPVSAFSAITQMFILLAAVANVIIGVGNDPCNSLLEGITHIIRAAFSLSLGPDGEFDEQQKHVLEELPLTLQSALKALKLDPQTTIYAACPSCHHTHAPVRNHRLTGDPVHPARCRNSVFRDKHGAAVPCDTPLLQRRHGRVRPIKPFIYHHLKDYLASTLSDPEVVEECNAACDDAWIAERAAMQQGKTKMSAEEVNNIFEAEFLRSFPGPVPDELFVNRGDRMRLAFEILIDFFNPHGLRKRGNHDSVGILALANLNLPNDKRYKPEFMWVSVILGPKEPNHDQIGAYLRPIVDEFVEGWKHGIHLSRVGGSDEPVRVDIAIALTVNDLPATRKILGLAGVGSNHICTICNCKGVADTHRSDLEHADWTRRNVANLYKWACAWRDAKSQAERDKIFKEHGVRWSELWQLPYWDPTRMGVVDTMHCILEGLVHYHCRRVLRIDAEFAKKKDSADIAFDFDWPEYNPAEYPFVIGESENDFKHVKRIQDKLVLALADEDEDEEGEEDEVLIEDDAERAPKGSMGGVLEAVLLKQLIKNHNLAALKFVAYSLGLNLTSEDTQKKHFAAKLMAWRLSKPRKSTDSVFRPKAIDTDQLKFIQRVIAETATPSWVNGVPSNYGESSAGTIKADEWRTLSTIYVPIALVLLWGDGLEDARLQGMLDHSMALFSAVVLVCRHSITRERTETYRALLKLWVDGLETHHPHTRAHARRPNIHLAFHVFDFLILFGPIIAWWSFPFERMIGFLQNINTNHRVGGQLEGIMTMSYARGANLRRWLRRPDCPEVIRQFKAIFVRAFGQEKVLSSAPLVSDGERASYTHNGVKFSRAATNLGDSLVFYYPSAATEPVVGSIEKILSQGNTTSFIVRRQAPLPQGSVDPFTRYRPHFPAVMYSSKMLETRDTIEPHQVLSHAARFDYLDRAVVLNLSRT